MTDESPTEPRSPAEARLDEHLEVLRAERVEPGHALAPRIVRTARWQQAVRAPLRVAGTIAVAFVDGITTLLGARGNRRP